MPHPETAQPAAPIEITFEALGMKFSVSLTPDQFKDLLAASQRRYEEILRGERERPFGLICSMTRMEG